MIYGYDIRKENIKGLKAKIKYLQKHLEICEDNISQMSKDLYTSIPTGLIDPIHKINELKTTRNLLKKELNETVDDLKGYYKK